LATWLAVAGDRSSAPDEAVGSTDAAGTSLTRTAAAITDSQTPEILPPPRPESSDKQPPVPITLDQAIHATLLSNPSLRSGLEAVKQAVATEGSARLLPNPTLLADMQMMPLTSPFTVDRTGGPPQSDLQIIFPIDWFLFGKRAAAVASASASVRVSEATFADSVRQAVLKTSLAFYDTLEAHLNLEVESLLLKELRRIEKELAKDKKWADQLSRVRDELLKQQRAVRSAEAAVVIARAQFRATVGIPNTEQDVAPTTRDWGLANERPPAVDQALAWAEENRADIQALGLKVRKAEAEITNQRAMAYPPVSPMIGYTHQFQEKAIASADANSWDVTLNVGLPFFNRNQYGIASAKSALTQSQRDLEAGLINLRAEIVNVFEDLNTQRESVELLKGKTILDAKEVLENALRACEKDPARLLEILDAIHNFHDFARLAVTNRSGYLHAVARFNAAIGKQLLRPTAMPYAAETIGR
jgi:cobalt-zinc-cadmium efflux system outer membrane protein